MIEPPDTSRLHEVQVLHGFSSIVIIAHAADAAEVARDDVLLPCKGVVLYPEVLIEVESAAGCAAVPTAPGASGQGVDALPVQFGPGNFQASPSPQHRDHRPHRATSRKRLNLSIPSLQRHPHFINVRMPVIHPADGMVRMGLD